MAVPKGVEQGSTRKAFLSRGGLFVSGAGLTLLAGCGAGGGIVPTASTTTKSPTLFKRQAPFTSRVTPISARSLHALDSAMLAPMAGTLSASDDGNQVAGVIAGSSLTASGSRILTGASQIVGIAINHGSSTFSMSAVAPSDAPFPGVTQTTTYSDGSTLKRTFTDQHNGTGTYTTADGRTWEITLSVSDAGLAMNFSGETAGSLNAALPLPSGVQGQARSAMCLTADQSDFWCKMGATFDASSAILAVTGVGAPAAGITGALGLAFGAYGAFSSHCPQ